MNQAAVDVAPTNPRWCVVTSKPGEEKLAKGQIDLLAKRTPAVIETYLPMRQAHRTARVPIQPLFPRHVFVRLDFASSEWTPIFTTHGVQVVIMAGDRPGWIRDQRIADIRAREVGGLVVLDDTPAPPAPPKPAPVVIEGEMECYWEPGDRVVLPDLPWEAVFSKRLDRNRAEVLISVLGSDSKPAKVERHLSELQPAPST